MNILNSLKALHGRKRVEIDKNYRDTLKAEGINAPLAKVRTLIKQGKAELQVPKQADDNQALALYDFIKQVLTNEKELNPTNRQAQKPQAG